MVYRTFSGNVYPTICPTSFKEYCLYYSPPVISLLELNSPHSTVLELRSPRASFLPHPRLRLPRPIHRPPLPTDLAPADLHLHPRKRPVDRKIRDFPHCVPAPPAAAAPSPAALPSSGSCSRGRTPCPTSPTTSAAGRRRGPGFVLCDRGAIWSAGLTVGSTVAARWQHLLPMSAARF